MPRQGHHPLGGWAPRGGASAASGPRGSRPGREGLGGSLRDEGKAEAWMPYSRFRSLAACSRMPVRFEEAVSSERRSSRPPRPRVPPKTKVSVFPLGRPEPDASAQSAPPGAPSASKPAAKSAFASRNRSELRSPHRRTFTGSRNPRWRPVSRLSDPKRTPIPRTAGPPPRPKPPRRPVSQPRKRANPLPPPPERQRTPKSPQRPASRFSNRSEPRSFELPDPLA
jgi:hypothetical protein